MGQIKKPSDPVRADDQSRRGSTEAMGGSAHEPKRAEDNKQANINKWSFGVLNDKHTDEVPGTELFLSQSFKPRHMICS